DTVKRYIKEIEKLADDQADKIRETNKEIEEGVFAATNDVKRPLVAPKAEPAPPHLNFAPLENGSDALARAAERYDRAMTRARKNGGAPLAQSSMAALNAQLILSERKLTLDAGLPIRPWFKHQLYAP